MGLVMISENFITCLLALRRHGYSEEAKHLEAEHRRFQIENTCLCDAIARDQKALRNAGFEMVNGCDGPAWKPPIGPPHPPLEGEARSRILKALGAVSIDDGIAKIAALKADNERLQEAHDHQYKMAGLMLREAEENGRQRDAALKREHEEEDARARVEAVRDRLAEVLTAMVRRIDAGSGYWQNETMCHLKEQLPAARALLRLP